MIYSNYFPHPFSAFLMTRIKPVKLACQNVLVRKENQEVKRTKDWQLAVILGILFISRLYTFLLKYPKNEPLFISYNFSFDRKDHIFLTCLSRWGSGEDSGNCIDPLRASGTTNMLFFWSTHFHLPKCYVPGSGQNCLLKETVQKEACLACKVYFMGIISRHSMHSSRGESEHTGCGVTYRLLVSAT